MEDSLSLLIYSPYYPPHIGGLENHAEQFTKHIAAAGHHVVVYTPKIPSSAPAYEKINDKIEIVRFPAFEITAGYPVPKIWVLEFWRQLMILRKKQYTAVCSRTRFFLTSLMAWVYARLTRSKYVHIEHGSDFVQTSQQHIRQLAHLYDMTFGTFVLLHADAVVANSKASARFVQRLTNQKITPSIIYRGVEEEGIEHIPPAPLPHKNIVITYVGRLMPGKGVADLLRALVAIKEISFTCYIVGNGPQETELRQLAVALGFSKDAIQFLGEKSHDDAISIIKISDIIVNPSYTEGLPTSVIEAALCKKAIIATDVGGTSEILTHNHSGILIQPKDVKALAAALRDLAENSAKRIQLGESAYTAVYGTFSWSAAVHAYETLFRKIYSQN